MDVLTVLAAFFSGIFASALSPLMTFLLCGTWGIVSVVGIAAHASFDFISLFPFGVFFGPHVAFGGSCAALAYASKKGYLDSGRDITLPMMGLMKPDVMVVGGIFGVLGYLLNYAISSTLGGKIDTISLAIWISAIIAKLAFDDSGLFGTVPPQDLAVGGRFSARSHTTWLPYMATPPMITVLAIGTGGLASYTVAQLIQNPDIAGLAGPLMFLICALPLALFYIGKPIAVTHHIAIGAGYAVMASNGNMLWGMACAILAAFLAEYLSRIFLVYGKTHVDPPAMAVTTISFLALYVIPSLGLYEAGDVIPIVIIVAAILYAFVSNASLSKHVAKKADIRA